MNGREFGINSSRPSPSFSESCSYFMTGWQELGAKDVQGSARLSKCLLNNAEVPKGKKGENTHTHAHTSEVDLVELFM